MTTQELLTAVTLTARLLPWRRDEEGQIRTRHPHLAEDACLLTAVAALLGLGDYRPEDWDAAALALGLPLPEASACVIAADNDMVDDRERARLRPLRQAQLAAVALEEVA